MSGVSDPMEGLPGDTHERAVLGALAASSTSASPSASKTRAHEHGGSVSKNPPTAVENLKGVIDKALDGTLARDRDPQPWEPQKLTPVHMQMIYDRVAGYQLKEIAERYEYTPVQVANVLGSPDAQTVISTILSMQSTGLLDMEARFKALAPEALNVQVGLMRDPEVHASVRAKITSTILDRAGYAPRTKSTIDVNQRIFLPAQVATGLKAALEESNRVRTVDYSKFLRSAGGAQAEQETSSKLESVGLGSGLPEALDGASPVPSSTEEAA